MLSAVSPRYLVCGFLLTWLFGWALGPGAQAYTYDVQVGTLVLTAQTSGPPATWPTLPIALTSMLGGPYDAVVAEAALTWNAVVPLFNVTASAPSVLRWAAPGELPPTLAAWTTKVLHDGHILRASVLLDPLVCWDLYEGPLRATVCHGVWMPLLDLQRVVLHELGHVAGLAHPDEGGQTVSAIMNSVASEVETLQADDAAGLRALYPVTASGQVLSRETGHGDGGGCTLRADSKGVDGVSLGLLGAWGITRLVRRWRRTRRHSG